MAGAIDDDAVVLRTVAFGEADQIVTLLTENHGRVSVFARSARKSTKRFAGGLGAFSRVRVSYVPRGEGLASLSGSEVTRRWNGLTERLERTAAAALVVEIVEHGLEEGQGDATLFERVVRCFEWLAGETNPVRVEAGVCRFALALLEDVGLGVALDASARSGRSAEDLRAPILVFGAGLVDSAERYPGETGVPLGGDSLAWLRTVQSGRFAPCERTVAADARDAVLAYAQGTTGRELRSLEFYREVMGAG